jgi:hypothetical protein
VRGDERQQEVADVFHDVFYVHSERLGWAMGGRTAFIRTSTNGINPKEKFGVINDVMSCHCVTHFSDCGLDGCRVSWIISTASLLFPRQMPIIKPCRPMHSVHNGIDTKMVKHQRMWYG